LKLVAIIGPSFSASTVLNYILDGLPGVLGAGETHWIVHEHPDNELAGRCRLCGPSPCPVFSEQLLGRLAATQSDWWGRLATAAGVDVVVSADKSPSYFGRFGMPDLALVPWRDPRAWVTGLMSRRPGTELTAAMERFVSEYRSKTTWLDTNGIPWVAVDMYDRFIDHPEEHLKELASIIGVSPEPTAWRFWETSHHTIGGGNMQGGFDKSLEQWRNAPKKLQRNEAWRERLTAQQARRVVENLAIQEIVHTLNREDVLAPSRFMNTLRRRAIQVGWRAERTLRKIWKK
jgi:hypothetical protein